MSHQTGIKANAELVKFFGKCRDGKIRLIKIQIVNEELTLIEHKEAKKDWEKDWDKLVKPSIEEEKPCYILYRLDSKTPLGHAWLLISWTPDVSSIRERMLYASTKATLKFEFGSAHIKEDYHATVKDETTWDGYCRHKRAFSGPQPLTTREEELQEIKNAHCKTDHHISSRHQTLSGVSCPLSEATLQSLHDLKRGSYNYLQFRIDLQEEKIHLVAASNIQLEKLSKQVPNDQARYHIYLFKHTHEGDYQENFVFIYSMPGYNCSVKERMMYSSCKAPFLETIEETGIEIIKKLEIDNGNELTEEFLYDELHPKKILHQPQFAKPKGPPNRGAKRLTRQAVE